MCIYIYIYARIHIFVYICMYVMSIHSCLCLPYHAPKDTKSDEEPDSSDDDGQPQWSNNRPPGRGLGFREMFRSLE